MTAQEILNSPSSIKRYSKYCNAANACVARSTKPHSIVLGDDGMYWVLLRGKAAVLVAAGYEYA